MCENEFEFAGAIYVAVDSPPAKPCERCDLFIDGKCMNSTEFNCFADFRIDGRNVIFKEKHL